MVLAGKPTGVVCSGGTVVATVRERRRWIPEIQMIGLIS